MPQNDSPFPSAAGPTSQPKTLPELHQDPIRVRIPVVQRDEAAGFHIQVTPEPGWRIVRRKQEKAVGGAHVLAIN